MGSIGEITIGIPVYNAEQYIEETIESAASQKNISKIVISDNVSTDGTGTICRRIAGKHRQVIYRLLPYNIGSSKNFELLLNEANSPYFLWLGAHDRLAENYTEALHQSLASKAEYVSSFSSSRPIDEIGSDIGEYHYSPQYIERLSAESPEERMMAFVECAQDGAMVHGLHRTDRLKLAWKIVPTSFVTDANLLVALLWLGKINHTGDTFIQLRRVRRDNNFSRNKRYNSGLFAGITRHKYCALEESTYNVEKLLELAGVPKSRYRFILERWKWQYRLGGIPWYIATRLKRLLGR